MASKTEGKHAGEFIISEAGGSRSREEVTFLSGQVVAAGDVVAKVTKGAGSSAVFTAPANTGNGTMGAITVGAGAKVGRYKLVIIEVAANAGKFVLEDPDGILVGVGTVAVAFSLGGIAFTLADGATDFVAGDGFFIDVAAGSLKYGLIDPEATNGLETPAGIAFDAYDATLADVKGAIIARDAEVKHDEIGYSDADTTEKAAIRAGLATIGIIVRTNEA